MLSTLTTAETAISTDSQALAYGNLYSFADLGSPADYHCHLPDPASSAGKFIGVRGLPLLTKVVTITRYGTEKINGLAANFNLVMNDFLTFMTDGTDWFVVGKVIPSFKASLATTGADAPDQKIVGASTTTLATVIDTNIDGYDTHGWFDNASHLFTPKMAGYYMFYYAYIAKDLAGGNFGQGEIWKNNPASGGIRLNSNIGFCVAGFYTPAPVLALSYANGTTDYFGAYAYHQEANKKILGSAATYAYNVFAAFKL
jgi:hypothetical protein